MLTFDEACDGLVEPLWYEAWRRDFTASESVLEAADLAVPVGEALAERCRRYAFRDDVAKLVVQQRASFDEPRVRRLGAHVQWLQTERYTPEGYLSLGWPPPPDRCPLLYVYAALGSAVRTEAWHAERDIEPGVTSATLWDIGQQVWLHREIHGEPGMTKGFWIAHHLASHLFRLGRLQHQRSWAKASLGPLREGEAVLDVHIPEDGPLTPRECDESFAWADVFFRKHLPDEDARWFTCSSWLLDPQLAEILPSDSNIVRFQRRFEPIETGERFSGSVFEFVFHRPDLDVAETPDLAGLPRRTALERAVIDHYEAGGRIHATLGAFERAGAGPAKVASRGSV